MDEQILRRAVEALSNGELVVYPTDTLYGLGADVFNDDAVKKVFKIKKRPLDLPLSVAVSDFDDLEEICFINELAIVLAERFLPGRLTMVLKKKKNVSDLVTGGLDKVAVRIPHNDTALKLLSYFGSITCTSANIHGMDTPYVIEDIKRQFDENDVSVFIDDGRLDGKPSTIVDLSDGVLQVLREGDITKKQLLDVIEKYE